MRPLLLSFFLSLCFLARFGLPANVPRAGQSQPGLRKPLYDLFPAPGPNSSETAEFIKATVGTDNLRPSLDSHDQLVSWTVEADEVEITRLEACHGIERVTNHGLPWSVPPEPGVSSRDSVEKSAEDDWTR